MANNRVCFTCGNAYSYCGTCNKDRLKPSWYSMFCSEECKDIDGIIVKNTLKELSDEDAKKELDKLDLTKIKFKNDSIKKRIDELKEIKLQETIEEEKVVEEEILDIKEKTENEKPVYKNKNSYKKGVNKK